MESFAALKRRTTDLFQNLPQSIPNPIKHHGDDGKKHHKAAMKGTWESLAIPPLPRSSHSLDVVAGTAYIFGGEAEEGGPAVDNDMHAVVLPFSSASADYYAIKAAAAQAVPVIQEPAVPEPAEQDEPDAFEEDDLQTPVAEQKSLDKDLSEVDLTSPPPAGAAQAKDAAETQATDIKGKDKEKAAPEPSSSLGDVPSARTGHATAVIGNRIFLFGGRPSSSPSSQTPIDERGRVWVFDTKSHRWSALDPAPPALPSPISSSTVRKAHFPPARSGHCAVATDKPDGETDRKRPASSWKQWAEGDSAEVGTPQRPIVGNITARARDHDADGFGTLVVHGGAGADGGVLADTWAFDVRSRVWQELPSYTAANSAAAQDAVVPAITISKSRLYRYGGGGGGGSHLVDYLELGVDTFDDMSTTRGEITLAARGTWKPLPEPHATSRNSATAADALEQQHPGARSAASLQAVTTGGGREYLVLLFGSSSSSADTGASVWALQVPPLGMSAASVTDAMMHALGRASGEGRWVRVETAAFDDEDDASVQGPAPRGWAASSGLTELEESGVVVFGGRREGSSSSGARLGDGWIFRLG